MTAAAAQAARPSTSPNSAESSALTGNPVPGLARALARLVPDPAAKAAVHQGATSQDIMDTAAMLLARAPSARPGRPGGRGRRRRAGWPARTGARS